MNTPTSTRPVASRRRSLLIGIAATTAALVGAGVAMSSTPAGANVDTWVPVSFTTGYSDVDPGQGFQETEWGEDGEGFVHLRGAIKADGAVVERAGGLTGPWMSVAFTLPCEARPPARVIQSIAATNLSINVSYQGLIRIETNGDVYLGNFDMPVDVDPETNVATADYFTSIDSITYEASDTACPEPTTTTAEETTTTTEP